MTGKKCGGPVKKLMKFRNKEQKRNLDL